MDPVKFSTILGLTVLPIFAALIVCFSVVQVHRRSWRVASITCLLCLLVIVLFWYSIPSRSARERQYRATFFSDPKRIKAVVIEPFYGANYSDDIIATNLVGRSVTCTNEQKLALFVEALRNVRIFTPQQPGVLWACRVRLVVGEEEFQFDVTNTGSDVNGVLIEVRYGWLEQAYRCDEVGPALKNLIES